MPILNLQKRARELGRIRIGQKTANGRPQKLDRFRITSYSKPLIEKVASLYGGDVQPWTPPGGSSQWEVITDASRIPILVPPQPVTQWLETWTRAGCIHRCDGETDFLTGEPCDLEDLAHLNARPTTRLKVVLRDVEGVGVFRLESHGWNAAVELPYAAEFMERAGGYIDGWLALEERVQIREVDGKPQTQKFMVPVIDIDVTPAQLLAGRGRVPTPEIEGPLEPKALAAGPIDEDYLVAARESGTLEGVKAAWHLAKDAGKLTKALEDELTKIAAEFTPAQPDVELNPDLVWQQILALAGEQGRELSAIVEEFPTITGGVLPEDASGADMAKYLEHLRAVKS